MSGVIRILMLNVDAKSRRVLELLRRRRNRENLSVDELILFTDQMFALYKAGFTLSRAADVIVEEVQSDLMCDALFTISAEIEQGKPLSKAIAGYGHIFPEYYVQNISAAEFSGVLEETLKRLSRYLKSERQLKQHINRMFLYPKLVTGLALLGTGVLAVVQGQIAISPRLVPYGVGALAALLLARESVRSVRFRPVLERLALRVWRAGPLYVKYLNKQFAELFVSLFKTGLPIKQVFELIGKALPNQVYGGAIRTIGARVDRGATVSEATDACAYFSLELKRLFRLGEITGEYDNNMDDFIQGQALEVTLETRKLSQYAYVVAMALVATLVGWMANTFTPLGGLY